MRTLRAVVIWMHGPEWDRLRALDTPATMVRMFTLSIAGTQPWHRQHPLPLPHPSCVWRGWRVLEHIEQPFDLYMKSCIWKDLEFTVLSAEQSIQDINRFKGSHIQVHNASDISFSREAHTSTQCLKTRASSRTFNKHVTWCYGPHWTVMSYLSLSGTQNPHKPYQRRSRVGSKSTEM